MAIDAELKGLSVVESGQDQSGSTSVMALVTPKQTSLQIDLLDTYTSTSMYTST